MTTITVSKDGTTKVTKRPMTDEEIAARDDELQLKAFLDIDTPTPKERDDVLKLLVERELNSR